jgi:integrase
MGNSKYAVQKSCIESKNGNQQQHCMITKEFIPLLEINQYLEQKSLRSPKTGKQYAKKLVVYLNWLDLRDLSYEKATNKYVKAFIQELIFGYPGVEDQSVQSMNSELGYSTISSYVTVITDFYRWLDDNYESRVSFSQDKDLKRVKKSYLYGQIYSSDYKYIIDRYLPRMNPSKDNIKWYTNDEKKLICSNFMTLRDECVFRLTLEGMRIDEALSVRLDDFDADAGVIKPSRSKGKPSVAYGRENHLRVVVLPSKTCEILARYLTTERMQAENDSMHISQYIFINLKVGRYQGKPLSYRNYLKILKTASKKAGLNPDRIRTHSGRSTKVMDVLEYGALHPESALTDVEILEVFGWKSTDSIEPYRNHNNPIIARSIIEKLNKMEGQDHD